MWPRKWHRFLILVLLYLKLPLGGVPNRTNTCVALVLHPVRMVPGLMLPHPDPDTPLQKILRVLLALGLIGPDALVIRLAGMHPFAPGPPQARPRITFRASSCRKGLLKPSRL